MPSIALTREGTYLDADQVPQSSWEALKAASVMGDFLMPCCRAPAILKTSLNGVQFFAHLADECATAPETVWHREGKSLVVAKLASMGIDCAEEVTGGLARDTWEADTLFRVGSRTVVVELQRSYQHLRDYIRRQERYRRSGVECYWLTRPENIRTLVKATSRERMKREWGGKFPPGQSSFSPLLPDFPVAILALGEQAEIHSLGLVRNTVEEWLRAIVEQRYLYNDGRWDIR
ncbi:competence protein CoiA [Paraburkholderia sp. SIMBA_054]|uniref:competence protein CoiA n=1 Tax=Paraburkholderia sp. SIMBA_054 TaxID=3085795 RepID=UPI00397D900E